ncbi:unnamed protein product [Alternaria alternata]
MSTHTWLKQEPVDQDDQVPDSAHSEYGQHTSSYGYSSPAIPHKVQIEMNLDMLANEEKTRSKKSSALRVGNSNNSGRPVTKTKMKRCAQDYTEDIGRLYMERIRKTVADDFIQHVHATLDLLSTDGIANKPSAIKAACMSHLSKVADQYVTRGKARVENSFCQSD